MGAGGCLWSDFAHEGLPTVCHVLLGEENSSLFDLKSTTQITAKELPSEDPKVGYQPARAGL